MFISLKKAVGEIKVDIPDLITRQMGKAVFDLINKRISAMHESELLVLDFEGILVIDASFIDELIIKIIMLSRNSSYPFFIKLKNISKSVEINIDLVLNSYSLFNKDRIVVLSDDICSNNSYYIGSLSEREKDILDYLRTNKSATLSDLAKFIGINESEVKKTLSELYGMRIIKQENGSYRSV